MQTEETGADLLTERTDGRRSQCSSSSVKSHRVCVAMERKTADFSGKWTMKSSENFEELLKALGVNVFFRKMAVAAASSPVVEISQQGEELSIKTSTSVRTTNISFTVGQSFSETTVDGRACTSFPRWETDSKISCEQTLQKGDGPKTGWTRELTNDGELILTMTAGDVVCTRVYQKE
ncbi:cellular retinoic acid-binding protein 2b [Takifugu flavidus]|uniref:cellular retinoic acid-binding protein 2b n=1 Tax=Takifugu flavidus TaxID=433684 RepID=UPI0025442CA8|nr:cellular retinoic acid-binding protein 2b [Takifugu flavidus]